MIDQAQYLTTLLNQIPELRFDVDRLSFVLDEEKYANVIKNIDDVQVHIERTGNNEVEIDTTQFPFYLYFDETDFIKRVKRDKWNKPSLIYTKAAFYDPGTHDTFINGTPSADYWLIVNNHSYFETLHFLKTKEHKEDSIFYFIDYFSWDAGIIVLTTLKKEGKLTISIPDSGLMLPNEIDLFKQSKRLKDAFADENRQFPKFIKNEMIASLAKFDVKKRMEQLMLTLGEILNVAEQNFEIYLHDLSLENLKKDFIDYKNKYFNQLREILSKLTNQVIGLPVTIAASVFSTYKVSDSPSTLIIILFVFMLYAGYSIFLLKLQKEDIRDIKEMFIKDFAYIENSVFFKKFPAELTDFTTAKDKINLRIRHLLQAVNIYYLLFSCSLIAFMCYVLIQLAIQFLAVIIALVAFVIICIVAFFLILR